jgi:hypothetical protein
VTQDSKATSIEANRVVDAPQRHTKVYTVMPDLDIWRAAAIIIQRHGADDAAIVAAQTADEFRAKGDEDGYSIWKAILGAVLELCRDKLAAGERLN